MRRTALVAEYVLEALPVSEMGAMDAHVSQCPECCREFQALQPIVDAFVHWPTYLLRPPTSLWRRLAERIATETGGEPIPAPAGPWAAEPKWKETCRESPASCWRPIPTNDVSACSCGSHAASNTPRIAMPEPRSCISSMASFGSTSASSARATTTGAESGHNGQPGLERDRLHLRLDHVPVRDELR